MKIVKRTPAGVQPVYDIGVSPVHNFRLENGLVASNCFNKSHSIAYSTITYICAYLKANYPLEFFTALMSLRSQSLQPKDWAIKVNQYIAEARSIGIKVSGPDINKSELGFLIRENTIYFGFNAIRNVGKTAARYIVSSRKKKPYADVLDFLSRVNRTKVTKKVFEALVVSGAFDSMGYKRQDLLDNIDTLYKYFDDKKEYLDYLERVKIHEEESKKTLLLIEERDQLRKKLRASSYKRNPGPQLTETEKERLDYLESLKLKRKPKLKERSDPSNNTPQIPKYSEVPISLEEIISQANYIGCYVLAHPAKILFPSSRDIKSLLIGEYARVSGAVTSLRKIKTKHNKPMMFLSITDGTEIADVVIFPKTYNQLLKANKIPNVGDIILIDAKVESELPDIKVICNRIVEIQHISGGILEEKS